MIIIGIAGGTGSGKTTVVKKIAESLPKDKVAVIPQDCYYKDNHHIPLEERLKMNYDEPDSIEWSLLVQHLNTLKEGKSIDMPTYEFVTCSRLKETITINPCEVIVVEGILVLCNEQLRNLMDIKVFVDTDADERLIRVINRDCVERGRTPQMSPLLPRRAISLLHRSQYELLSRGNERGIVGNKSFVSRRAPP